MLQESEIHFEVLQEYSPGTRAERIVLGNVKLNLAEFVGGSDDGEDAVTRRYLMQESKINSTLKVLYMFSFTSMQRLTNNLARYHDDSNRGFSRLHRSTSQNRPSLWRHSRHHDR